MSLYTHWHTAAQYFLSNVGNIYSVYLFLCPASLLDDELGDVPGVGHVAGQVAHSALTDLRSDTTIRWRHESSLLLRSCPVLTWHWLTHAANLSTHCSGHHCCPATHMRLRQLQQLACHPPSPHDTLSPPSYYEWQLSTTCHKCIKLYFRYRIKYQ